jgi:hypothetical protein
MRLINAHDTIHEVSFFFLAISILRAEAGHWTVSKSHKVENVACQTYEGSDEHHFCVDGVLILVMVQDSVSSLPRQPHNHAPDNQH